MVDGVEGEDLVGGGTDGIFCFGNLSGTIALVVGPKMRL